MNSKVSAKRPVRDDPFPRVLEEFGIDISEFKPPFLDVGSFIPPNKKDRRELFAGEYLGVDIQAGIGVDHVLDITYDIGDIVSSCVRFHGFNTVFCIDTLEHIDRPWLAAQNIQYLMAEDAQIYISVPFIWRYHPYPKDYWRMAPDAIRVLFPEIEWTHEFCTDFMNNIFPIEQLNIHPGKKKAPFGYASICLIHMLGRKR